MQKGESPAAGASDRLRLEVALLIAATALPSPAPEQPAAGAEARHTVLMVVGDAELRSYIGACLRERGDLCVR